MRVFGDFSRGTERLLGEYFGIMWDLSPSQTRPGVFLFDKKSFWVNIIFFKLVTSPLPKWPKLWCASEASN